MESVLPKPMCVSRIGCIGSKTSMSRARKLQSFILKERSLSSRTALPIECKKCTIHGGETNYI